MDTQKIKNQAKYYADIIKDVDNGKILALGGKLIESVDLKKLKSSFDFSAEGPIQDKVDHIWRLSKDIATWPVNYVEGLVGAIKNKKSK